MPKQKSVEIVNEFTVLALDASMDPACILDNAGRIMMTNIAMRKFLGLRARQFDDHPEFCDLVQLHVCEGGCKIIEMFHSGGIFKIDESPAVIKGTKKRLSVKAVPFFMSGERDFPDGAILSVRDSTAEIIVQAKYHKLMSTINEKDIDIEELQNALHSLRSSVRGRK